MATTGMDARLYTMKIHNFKDGIGYVSLLPSGDVEIVQEMKVPVVSGFTRVSPGTVILPKSEAIELAKLILGIEQE